MADKLIEQEVVVSVDQALKAIEELKKQVEDLTKKVDDNSKGQEENTNQNKKNTDQQKKQNKEIKELSSSLKSAKRSADSVIASLKKMTGISFSKLINNSSKLGRGLYEMLGHSINASEQLNMFNVVFGNMEKDGEKVFSDLGLKATRFQNQLNELFSTNKIETLQMQALFQSLATNTGVQADVAEKMSERMVLLTYDLASLYNKSETEVAKAIQSGVYAGQTRPMRQVGVDLTQNNLGVTLQEIGINDKAVSDLSQAEKQVLRYITAVKSASVANNDFAHTINSPANQLKILKQQFVELSVAIGNLFMRAFANILPYVNAIIMVVKEVLKTIALLFGIETEDYNTAQSSIGGLSEAYDGVGDSANNASNAVKELKRQTLGFDQINNLTTPAKNTGSGGSGSGGGGAIGAIDQRLIDALDKYDLKLDEVHNKAREIRDRIMEWLGFTKEIDEKTGEVTFKFGLINKTSVEIAEIYGKKLAEGLSSLANDIPWEEIGAKLANGLNTIATFINSFFDNFDWAQLGRNIANGLNKFIDDIDAVSLGRAFTQKVKAIFETALAFVTTFDWSQFGSKIAQFLNGALENIDLGQIAKTIRVTIEGILTVIGKVFTEFNWSGLFSNLISGFNNLNGVLKALIIAKVATSVVEFTKNLEKSYDNLKKNIEKTKEWYDKTSVLNQSLVNIGIALGGIVSMVAGFTSIKNAFADMAENGVNLGNVIEAISGAVMVMAGAWAVAQVAVKVFAINMEADLTAATGGLYAIVVAIGMIVAAIMGYKSSIEEETQSIQDNTDAIEANKEAYERQKQAIIDTADTTAKTDIYKLNKLQDNISKLDELTDSQGRVKKGCEALVAYILKEVSDATGVEYQLIDGFIYKNGKKIKSIEKEKKALEEVIETKRIESLVNAYQDVYTNALKETAEAQYKVNDLQDQINEAVKNGDYEKANSLEKERVKTAEVIDKNKELISSYENLSGGLSAGLKLNSADMKKYIGDFESAYKVSLSKMEQQSYAFNQVFIDTNDTIKECKNNIDGLNYNKVDIKTTTSTDSNFKKIEKYEKNGITVNINGKMNYTPVDIKGSFKAGGGLFKNGSWKPIQQYAYGGLPSTGQLFMAREAGPELVGKIGNSTAVMNNNQIVSSVALGVAQAVKGVMAGGSGGIEVYVHTDEGVVVDRINRITKRTGECPIQI